jgi:hypothetical protein
MIDEELEDNLDTNLENQEEEPLFRDKIFDNQFEQTELDTSEKSFQIDSSILEKTLDERIDELMIQTQIKDILLNDLRYNRFNVVTAEGTFPKINKSDINEIYRHVLDKIPGVPIIEAFSIITSIYDISPEKFYESLSNTFKTDLITELKNRGYLKNRKSLF